MSKVITFSTAFQKDHPRAGEPTYFVEKIWAGLADAPIRFRMPPHYTNYEFSEYYHGIPKVHTIRSGHRWKVGDKFSPRVWSGKPYQSKQTIIAPDIEIKKIWDFQLHIGGYFINRIELGLTELTLLAKNDGLDVDDFESWFKCEEFSGQIICWDEKIEY